MYLQWKEWLIAAVNETIIFSDIIRLENTYCMIQSCDSISKELQSPEHNCFKVPGDDEVTESFWQATGSKVTVPKALTPLDDSHFIWRKSFFFLPLPPAKP